MVYETKDLYFAAYLLGRDGNLLDVHVDGRGHGAFKIDVPDESFRECRLDWLDSTERRYLGRLHALKDLCSVPR